MAESDGLALGTGVLLRDRLRCQACGIPAKPILTTHHIVARVKEGQHIPNPAVIFRR